MINPLTIDRRDYIVSISLILLSILAWLPLFVQDYILVADDYPFFDLAQNGGLPRVFQIYGFWRLLGVTIGPFSLIHGFYPWLVLITHILVGLIIYTLLRQLFKNYDICLWLASLAVVYPAYYQALVWNIVYDRPFATLLFLVNILALVFSLRSKSLKSEPYFFLISYLATVLSLLGNESLFFALLFSSSLVWLLPSDIEFQSIKEKLFKKYSAWAPIVGCLSFGVLYKLFETGNAFKEVSKISPDTLLSVYYYQKNHLQYTLEPWLSSETVRLIFYAWSSTNFIVAIITAVLLIVALVTFSREQKSLASSKNSSDNPKRQKYQVLGSIVLLLLGGSLIYVFGDGYSLESRKVYPLFPLLTLLLGWLLKYCNPIFNLIVYNQMSIKLFNFFIISLATLFVTTAWLVTGIWHHEVQRYDSLIEFINTNGIEGEVKVEWIPNLYEAWPHMSTTWGFRLDDQWVLNTSGLNVNTIRDQSISSEVKVIRFDPENRIWKRVN